MNNAEDTVRAADIIAAIWKSRWIILITSLVLTAITVVYLVLSPNIYRSEALVAPASESGGNALSALASQYGGLLGLSGINLGSGSGNKKAIGLETLKSRRFIGQFIEEHELLVPLFAAEGWDRDARTLVLDDSVFDSKKSAWVRDVSPPRTQIPSTQEAVEEFRKYFRVREDGDTGMVTISFEHVSPDIAKEWVSLLIADLNAWIRQKDIREARQAIEYLEEQAQVTSLAEVKAVFYDLIQEQVKTVMLANVSDEYFLRIVDPAVASEEASRPKRAILSILALIGFVFVGCICAVVYWLVLNRYKGA